MENNKVKHSHISIIAFTLLLLTSQTFAQNDFGIRVGLNGGNMTYELDKELDMPLVEPFLRRGYTIGFIKDFSLLRDVLSIQSSVLYTTKGCKLDYEDAIQEYLEDYYREMQIDSRVDIDNYEGYAEQIYYYLEIPIQVVYKYHGIQLAAGPYLGFGLGGAFQHDFSYEINGYDVDSRDLFDRRSYTLVPVLGRVNDEKFDDKYIDNEKAYTMYRMIDPGLDFGIGYQLGNLLLQVNHSFSLRNLTPDYSSVANYRMYEDIPEKKVLKHKVWIVSVSYFLF